MKNIFIIVPSPHPTGPIKGAVALANAVAQNHPTTIVYLKPGPGVDTIFDKSIRIVSLSNIKNPYQKLKTYKNLLVRAGKRKNIFSISFCFSADITNLLCSKQAINCSSIRGNLPINYQYEFGKFGLFLAALHLFFIRWFDHVIAMNMNMAQQLKNYSGKDPHIVGNFVDENMLNHYRKRLPKKDGIFRFIYVGRLTKLKKIQVLMNAVKILKVQGQSFHLDIVGDGELYPELIRLSKQIDINDVVAFHGHLKLPYPLISQADCLVLPSFTEGVSRAVLEALYLGVPCLVRNIDGNSELITNGKNGYLFEHDDDLSELMIKTAALSRKPVNESDNLLPDTYRQEANIRKLLGIING